jgi:hypothetical protein
MSVSYYGDFAEDDTVIIPFNTFSSDDPSASVTITNLVDTDVWIYKDASNTQYAADACVNLSLNHDSITGSHLCSIDTSENAYFATGSEYAVRIVGTTVDGATIEAWIGAFSIERAGGALALLKTINIANGAVEADMTYIHGTALTETAGQLAAGFKKCFDVATPLLDSSENYPTVTEFEARTIVSANYVVVGDTIAGVTTCTTNTDLVTAANVVDEFETQSQADPTGFHVNVLEIGGTAQTANDNGADINAILTDTNELQGDWANAGRLDAILDIIAADTTTDIPALIATAQTDLDTITGADGVTIASAQDLTATMKTSVNTEVSDVIKTDTVVEMSQGAPPASPTIEQILNYLYRMLRNKTETIAAEIAVYNDAGDTKLFKAVLSDDATTFTKAEHGSGA